MDNTCLHKLQPLAGITYYTNTINAKFNQVPIVLLKTKVESVNTLKSQDTNRL